MQIAKTAVNPGASFFAVSAVVRSDAGAVAFAAAGLFVGAGVTLSPGGVAVAFVDAACAFVAVTVGVGVSNHPGGYVPPPPLEPTSPKMLAGGLSALGACTLSLTQPAESVPVPDAFHAHTAMFAQPHGPTVTFMDVAVVPFVHVSFMLML